MSVSMAGEAVAVMVNWAGTFGQLADHVGGVVQVHQAQQALHDRDAGVGDRRADRRENGGPARPTSASGTVVRPGASGSPKVAVTPVWSATRSGSQSTVTVAVPSTDRRQEFRPVDTGGDRQHRAHGGGGVFGGDHRSAAVDGVGGQGEWDVDPGARHRHAQHDTVAVDLKPRTGG